MARLRADAAVLVLLGGEGLVLLARKNCSGTSGWACDAALPGGHIRPGEGEVEAAIREAWEEAWVHPDSVDVVCLGPLHMTSRGGILVRPVIARARGPLCPKPRSGELDRVMWVRIDQVTGRPWRRLLHPRGIEVVGVELPGGVIVWGLTLRILTWVSSAYPWLRGGPGGICYAP